MKAVDNSHDHPRSRALPCHHAGPACPVKFEEPANWSGWVFGALGVVIGVVGIVWGIWARSNPGQSVLLRDITQTPIGLPNDPLVQVIYKGDVLTNPVLVTLSVMHASGEEIDTFPPGAITFAAAEPGVLKGLLGQCDASADLDLTSGVVSVKPRIFKEGESLVLTIIATGKTKITPHVRIAKTRDMSTAEYDQRSSRLQRSMFSVGALTAAFGSSMLMLALQLKGPAAEWLDRASLTLTLTAVGLRQPPG